jgi:hypothetical protein
MRTRRLTTAGLGAFAALALGLAGCAADDSTGSGSGTSGGATPGTATSAPAAGEAASKLAAAAQKLNDDTVTARLESAGITSTSAVDPKADKANATMTITSTTGSAEFAVRAVGEDVYIQADGLPNVQPGKWLHIDGTKAAGSSFDLIPDGDAAGAGKFLNTVAEAQETSPGSFSGTLDLTKMPTGSSGVSVNALGDKAKAVPFTATVDDQGRLNTLTIDMSAIDAKLGTLKTTYSGFGEPVSVEAPAAADTVEPDPQLLKLLGLG